MASTISTFVALAVVLGFGFFIYKKATAKKKKSSGTTDGGAGGGGRGNEPGQTHEK